MAKHAIWALVPASGMGNRMGATVPKQYLKIDGKTVIEHTLDRLAQCPSVEKVVVGVSAKDNYWQQLNYTHPKLHSVVIGGAERSDTVLNLVSAIEHCAETANISQWALVHDAVRPCVRVADIERLIAKATELQVGGLLGVPIADTLKRTDASQTVVKTVARQQLWRAFTPQLFSAVELLKALQQTHEVTDEASAIEQNGGRAFIMHGAADNIKITDPEDLHLAKLILKAQHDQQLEQAN